MSRVVKADRAQTLAARVAAGVLVAAFGSSAAATDPETRVEASTKAIEMELHGRIDELCEVSGGAAIDFGADPRGGVSMAAVFGLVCNTPFDLTVASSNGGLAHTTLPDGQGPYAGTLLYTIDVKVPLWHSTDVRGLLEAQFDSDKLMGAQTVNSGDSIAAGGGEMVFRTHAPTGAGLLAGDYSDDLTVTVSSRL